MKLKYWTLALLLIGQLAHADTQERSARSKDTQLGEVKGEIEKKRQPDAASQAQGHTAKQLAAPLIRQAGDRRNLGTDFWIFDAWVTLDIDEDFDGFYSGFSLEFDADTVFTSADVYARLFLSRGDVFEEYHTTSVFRINGDSSQDSLLVESDLLTGFPADDYELLIELYDAFDDSLVAVFDGYNDADLSLLPLESRSFDAPEPVTVISTESGGSFGYLMLLLVPLLLRRTGR